MSSGIVTAGASAQSLAKAKPSADGTNARAPGFPILPVSPPRGDLVYVVRADFSAVRFVVSNVVAFGYQVGPGYSRRHGHRSE
jgi:hypothetical protein